MSRGAAFFGRRTPAQKRLGAVATVLGLAALTAALLAGAAPAPGNPHDGPDLGAAGSTTTSGGRSSPTSRTTVPTVLPTSTSTTTVTTTTSPPAPVTSTTPGAAQPTTPVSTTTAGGSGSLSRFPFRDGAYTGAADPSGLAAFDATTGTESEIASDYLPSNSGWSGMDGAGGSLSWLTNAWAGTGYTLSLGVPIIPTDSSGTAQGSLATGATGAYNGYFVTLAQTLIAAGESNAFLRLGWEFDYVGGYPWTVGNPAEAASYVAYFDQIVTAMRSVPGENFSFVWNPDAGAFIESGYNVALSYPGNAYVNVIGVDAYDQSWASPHTAANAWAVTTLPALSAARAFAAAQGKPLAICEWGIAFEGEGLGDDPLFVNDMAAWMHDSANDVVYESYFNYAGNSDSVLTGGAAPASLAAFEADFG